MKAGYAPFDAADCLDNDALIAEYLSAAAEEENADVFVAALGDVAKARGKAHIATESCLVARAGTKRIAQARIPDIRPSTPSCARSA
jgi:probable addiction module antidote protein